VVERCGGQPIMILIIQHPFGILVGRPVDDGSLGRLWADPPRWWAIRPGQPAGAGTYAVAMPGDKEAGARMWGLMGVPSSVAAHWPGIEQGPAALREGGLLGTLRAHGVRVADHGDLAVARWTAERTDGRPNAWRQVVEVVQAARSAISEVLAAGQAPLVLGGECTLAIALVAAVVGRYGEVGLLYVDGGQDLMIPIDHPREPILDAMGVAHMLDLPGCVPELAGIGSRRPLLQPADVAFVGFVGDEEDVHGLVSAPRLPGAEVIANPVAAGRRALTALPHRHLVLHFDVDVVDALDLPLADIATYGTGVQLDHVAPLLGTLVADPRVVGMSVVEANPDHDPDGTSIRRLLAVIAGALAAAD
jgi:arginase